MVQQSYSWFGFDYNFDMWRAEYARTAFLWDFLYKQISSINAVLTEYFPEAPSYKVSGGLHGVGVSVVNALSEWLEVEVRKTGVIHYQKYHRGKPEEDVKIIGSCGEDEHGTIVRFKADGEIFETDRKRHV